MSEVEEVGGGLGPVSNSMAAFSDKLDDLSDALNILYIRKNAGGRHRFREKWPEVAEFLFDEQLTLFDVEGFEYDERQKRSELEDEADIRRIELKKVIAEIVEESVHAGSLQFDYVGGVIDKYGAKMSMYLYDRPVIERVRPGLMAELEAEEKEVEEKARVEREQRENEIRNKLEQSGKLADEVKPEQESEVNSEVLHEEVIMGQVHQQEEAEEAPSALVSEGEEVENHQDQKLSYEEKVILSNNGNGSSGEKIEEALIHDIAADVKPIEVGAGAVPEGQEGGGVIPSIFEVGSEVQEKKAHYISTVDKEEPEPEVEVEVEDKVDTETEEEQKEDDVIGKWRI